MTPYSQQDQQWAGVKMNGTTSTIGRYGCLVTALGIVTDTTPDKVNDLLSKNHGYDNDLVLWSGVPKSLPLDLISLPLAYDNTKVLDIIAREGFCIVEVDFNGVIDTIADAHWVVYIGNHQCIDPWDGRTKPTVAYKISKKYVYLHKRSVVVPPTPPTTVITDPQAKIDLLGEFGVQELQAVRSLVSDQKRTITSLDLEVAGYETTIASLNMDNEELRKAASTQADIIIKLNALISDTKVAPQPPSFYMVIGLLVTYLENKWTKLKQY